jgi:preprotein translocase subunit SecF
MGLHNNMFVIKYKKFFVGLSLFFVAVSLAFIAIFGLKLGIDFKGGSSIDLNYPVARPEITEIKSALLNAGFGDVSVQPIGTNGIVIKSRDLTESERSNVVSVASLGGKSQVEQKSFTTVGPSVGSELKKKAIASIILVLIAIILFVAYAFRKVSYPVSSWKYGFVVITALIHDIIIPTGIFALLGYLFGVEVDTLFIVALLTTLGLSISDTIVVFDRVRENISIDKNKPFDQIVGNSLSQTFARSINTSILVLVMVFCLIFFGPESTRLFSIVLAIGMFFGIYSSIFLASPLLVLIESLQRKQK